VDTKFLLSVLNPNGQQKGLLPQFSIATHFAFEQAEVELLLVHFWGWCCFPVVGHKNCLRFDQKELKRKSY